MCVVFGVQAAVTHEIHKNHPIKYLKDSTSTFPLLKCK